MENTITNPVNQNALPVNAHFDIKLEGWPAAATFMTICISGVALYTIYATTGKALPFPRIA